MKPEIAIALSGGGYRAAMFHLGTLSYLYHLQSEEGDTFLDMVNTISTISGGTITGLWYMMQYANDNISDESFRELYHKLRKSNVVEKGLHNLLINKRKSLIKEMVEIYDKEFFNGTRFDVILNKIDSGHIHHFSANGTDFSSGYAFRFQASRRIKNIDQKFSRGFIGNNNNRIPWDMAKQIKLSEMLAVSSCFPGGFEPMFFPSDFDFYNEQSDIDKNEINDIPLMDGGIVDNQGIEPILLANSQMQYDDERAKGNKDFPCLDLIIVSDVTSPETETITKCSYNKLTQLSMRMADKYLCIGLLLGLIVCCMSACFGCSALAGFFLCLEILLAMLRICSCVIKQKVVRAISNLPIQIDINQLWKFPFSNILSLLHNRFASLLQLSKAVFMKPIRQMRYKAIYESRMWKNRRITNTIYELTEKYGSWKRKLQKGNIPDWLAPSEEIIKNSEKATRMGTTLWFTDKDRDNGLPEVLLACGQYNICMNLLEYLQKIKKDDTNTNESHQQLMKFEKALMSDWEMFKKNPMWMAY